MSISNTLIIDKSVDSSENSRRAGELAVLMPYRDRSLERSTPSVLDIAAGATTAM
jgi:hypothetical protein